MDGRGNPVPDLGMGRVLPLGKTQTVEDAETGWVVTVPWGTPGIHGLYALLREQILALQGRVAALEAGHDGESGAGGVVTGDAEAE